MILRLTRALVQLKAGNTSKILINEIHLIIYSLYQANEVTKKIYYNIVNLKKV